MSAPNKISVSDVPGVTPSKNGSTMVIAGGLVFVSGVVAKSDAGEWVEGDIKVHTRIAIGNAQKRLQHIGLDLGDVVSATIYLSKYDEDFNNMNEAYFECFENFKPLPARACVGISKMGNNTDIEISFVAATRK
ncbi:Endoribonuclease L-PSP/chorismate mutase-like protein [Naematelia encephala]|uniref:Endoribonuclease L-PSP/chorismate mutase-like protein n=1 Tax=Naematelia encephala TaxID=71784 RepID=A0A1Y2AZK7_9TREE|nr:Endoribonuclease L-PSP/chorismate mutase-like protein [Naematelia encephala]